MVTERQQLYSFDSLLRGPYKKESLTWLTKAMKCVVLQYGWHQVTTGGLRECFDFLLALKSFLNDSRLIRINMALLVYREDEYLMDHLSEEMKEWYKHHVSLVMFWV